MESLGAGAVRELLDKYGFRYSKAMGQNFLTDVNIPEKIVRLSGIDDKCGVLEIGPGMGALTRALSSAAGSVAAVEIDARLLPILRETLSGVTNVEIIRGDILKFDIAKLVCERMPGMCYHACANLPYSITSPALSALINSGVFETITVMVQREVAARIVATPGTPEYGAYTVFVNYHTKPEILFDVSPECFFPRPKVFSSVVRMDKRPEPLLGTDDELLFFRIVRAAFGQRRKTLVNTLQVSFGQSFDKEGLAGIVEDCGFDTRIRGETLCLEEFISLTLALKNKY